MSDSEKDKKFNSTDDDDNSPNAKIRRRKNVSFFYLSDF
jgi:hypothetical protein